MHGVAAALRALEPPERQCYANWSAPDRAPSRVGPRMARLRTMSRIE